MADDDANPKKRVLPDMPNLNKRFKIRISNPSTASARLRKGGGAPNVLEKECGVSSVLEEGGDLLLVEKEFGEPLLVDNAGVESNVSVLEKGDEPLVVEMEVDGSGVVEKVGVESSLVKEGGERIVVEKVGGELVLKKGELLVKVGVEEG